jgi:hypothetical protein
MKARIIAWLGSVILTAGIGQAAETLTISDPIGRPWRREPICWQLSAPAGVAEGQVDVSVTRDGKPIPAQAYVKGKTAEVRLIVDQLAEDASTTLTCEFGKSGPKNTDLKVSRQDGVLILENSKTAIRLLESAAQKADGGALSPVVGIRTASGKWTGGGHYEMASAKPVGLKTELLENGPVRLVARVTTTFDNGRHHSVNVTLVAGGPAIDLEEQFDVGPDEKYQFKPYKEDRDELAWEWWSWYGDSTDMAKDGHPNNWVFTLNSPEFAPRVARLSNSDRATDPSKADQGNGYDLTYAKPRLEVFVEPIYWWRPDGVAWFAACSSREANADVIGVCANRARDWRNPNVLPVDNITLRTRANSLRVISQPGGKLAVQCPIGLGSRSWTVRTSNWAESFAPVDQAATVLTAENVRKDFALDRARQWITDWPMNFDYPRLFIKPSERAAYYARLKGHGCGSPGIPLNDFLSAQDAAQAQRLYDSALANADKMINGYFENGVNGYPGWMLGYWHGIVVAAEMDNLLGSSHCTPEMARTLKKKMAILTYLLTDPSNWPDKQINYGWGSMNMPVGRWGGLVVMASSISDHPLARQWLRDADRYFKMLLQTEFAPDGTQISCPHYIGAASTSFYAWIALANSGLGPDVSQSPVLRNFARYYMQLMTPIDARWGLRTLLNEGDTRPGSSPLPGILATLFRRTDPQLAGQLIQIWRDGGQDVTGGMGVPDALIIDADIKSVPPRLGPEVFPGFGAFLRYRQPGTPEEAYLAFVAGNFMIDHANTDQLAFQWYEKGMPLTLFTGDMYVPGAVTALSHNTLCWDVQPEGPPTPGKDQPGDWYHDHGVPWVEHKNRPRLHKQIGWDERQQKITDTRGLVTFASDTPGAALVEGQVDVKVLSEVPTRPDYSTAMMAQIASPSVPLQKPFTWTRRLLYVKAPEAAGMNYLVVRDDQGGFDEYVPSFSYWSLSDDVELAGRESHFRGQLGVDTDLYVLAPAQVRLFKDAFTHNQCEPIVGHRHREKSGQAFSEKQVVCRIEGQKGSGFLVVVFPRKADEPRPAVTPWLDSRGLKIVWKGETHFVLLDTREREIRADGIQAKTACLVAKVRDGQNFSLHLPAGGQVSYGGEMLQETGPAELTRAQGRTLRTAGKPL